MLVSHYSVRHSKRFQSPLIHLVPESINTGRLTLLQWDILYCSKYVCVYVVAETSNSIVTAEYSCCCSGGRVSSGEPKSSFNEFSRGTRNTVHIMKQCKYRQQTVCLCVAVVSKAIFQFSSVSVQRLLNWFGWVRKILRETPIHIEQARKKDGNHYFQGCSIKL